MGSEAEPADPWPQPDAVALATGHEKDAGGAGVDQAARTVAMKSQCASTRTSVAPASQAASPWLMTPAIADPPPPTSTNPGPPESKAQGCAGSRVIRKVDAPTSEMAEVPVRRTPSSAELAPVRPKPATFTVVPARSVGSHNALAGATSASVARRMTARSWSADEGSSANPGCDAAPMTGMPTPWPATSSVKAHSWSAAPSIRQ